MVKGPAAPREFRFYTDIAPALPEVPVPQLRGAHQGQDGFWLVLELVPHPLPRHE